MNNRIGPKMRLAAEYVAANPGCTKLAVAEYVGPNGSRNYGYQIVNRAISAGLITASSRNRREYALYVA